MTILFTINQISSGSFSIRKMNRNDIDFYNEVRNLVRNNLHDNTFFSKEQSLNWFDVQSPMFFIAELNSKPVGYFRTSDYSSNYCMVGMDIAPSFQGKGLSTPFYHLFFQLLSKNSISKVGLKVFSKNHIAHNLYKKLGFKEISQGFHTRRDGGTFEEIFMERDL